MATTPAQIQQALENKMTALGADNTYRIAQLQYEKAQAQARIVVINDELALLGGLSVKYENVILGVCEAPTAS